MNRDHARFILQSARSADLQGPVSPATDPLLAEAWQIAENDPELRSWLHSQLESDQLIRAKLKQIEPPPELRNRILAPTSLRPSRSFRPLLPWMALAASVLLLFTFINLRFLRTIPVAAEFVRYLNDSWDHRFDFSNRSFAALQSWLQTRPSPATITAPASLATLPTYGCRVFKWRNHDAVLVCFSDPNSGAVVHVIRVPRSSLQPHELPAPEPTPSATSNPQWAAVAWVDTQHAYFALSEIDPKALLQLVRG